jgi:diguanylate cyclase
MSSDFYEEESPRASENMRLAITLLSKHAIPVSPLNYRIAYDYMAGRNQRLNTAFDKLVAAESPPSGTDLHQLYKQHYSQNASELEEIRQEFIAILATLHAGLSRSENHLDGYIGRLDQFAEILNQKLSPRQLSTEVDSVISETRETGHVQRDMKAQLDQMSSEMEAMRAELAQIKEQSLKDMLTGIANRNAFDRSLDELLVRANEDRSRFSLLLLDIDHFKQVNDTYGHLVGDKILRFVAATIKRCVKGKDFVARFGGEEFAVILPGTEMAGAYVAAEQIRKAVAHSVLKDTQTQKSYGNITISIGVSQTERGDLPLTVIERADQALYRAKDNGRNRVECAR